MTYTKYYGVTKLKYIKYMFDKHTNEIQEWNMYKLLLLNFYAK